MTVEHFVEHFFTQNGFGDLGAAQLDLYAPTSPSPQNNFEFRDLRDYSLCLKLFHL